ncbi:hypothetical protein Tco_0852093 [Tanacetum coccineum]
MCDWLLSGLRLLVGMDRQALLGLDLILNKVVEMISCINKSKLLALSWGKTPRLDSGVRASLVLGFPGILSIIVVARGPNAMVRLRPKGLLYLLYVIKSPQSSILLRAEFVLRAVNVARLCSFSAPPLPSSVTVDFSVNFP